MPKKGGQLHTVLTSYVIESSIGNGGAGNVYQVTSETGERLAAKVLCREANTEKRKRFVREMEYCKATDNPSMVNVVDFGLCEQNGARLPFYVMPLYDGSLRQSMKEGWYDAPAHFAMFAKMLGNLKSFHQEGNIHRDIKPENILVDRKKDSLVLADFGIAHLSADYPGQTIETRAGDRLANFAYASPEQRSGNGPIDCKSDIFSFGLILVEMFTGEIPYGVNYTRIGDKWPDFKFLDKVADKMLAQKPGERYSNLGDVLIEVEALSRIANAEVGLGAVLNNSNNKGEPRYAISIRDMRWIDGDVVITLNEQPDRMWIGCFQSNPMNYFDTTGYRFGPRYWTPYMGQIRISGTCGDDQRITKIRDNFPMFIEYANRAANEAAIEAAKKKHEEDVASAKARLEREKRDAEINARLNGFLSG